MKVVVDGKPYGEFPVVALETVPQAGFIGAPSTRFASGSMNVNA